MRGHLQQRGRESWRLKVFIGRDAEGKRRYVERTFRGNRGDAERALTRLVVEVDDGRHAAAAPMTFGELLDRWLAVKRQMVEATTLSSYEWVARKYLRPTLGGRKLASLRPVELDGLYAELRERGLSARTVRICHTVIRQSLEQARRWGLIARSPAVDASPPSQPYMRSAVGGRTTVARIASSCRSATHSLSRCAQRRGMSTSTRR